MDEELTMSVDDRALGELIEESQDLQSDAMRRACSTIPDLEDVREESRREEVDPDEVARFNESRRGLLKDLGLGAGGFARRGALAGGLGAALAALIVSPASAAKKKKLDVQILQTASSLEILAIATYDAALGLPFIKDGNEVVVTFAETTMMQHDEHRKAFQAQTKALDGKKQKQPNPKYAPVVEEAKPGLQTPLDVVNLAATIEQVATETYLADLSMFSNKKSKSIMASVMGVESQHLATLRAVRALLEGGGADLIAIPTDVAALPAAAGSVAFPDPFQGTSMASPPEEGAVK
ncbi:MAG: ferritin-like domain-containing protein [Actinobacteria bacterium]|nr:ferritin-like domain-containing protein [Actinomycetota bacterium]